MKVFLLPKKLNFGPVTFNTRALLTQKSKATNKILRIEKEGLGGEEVNRTLFSQKYSPKPHLEVINGQCTRASLKRFQIFAEVPPCS